VGDFLAGPAVGGYRDFAGFGLEALENFTEHRAAGRGPGAAAVIATTRGATTAPVAAIVMSTSATVAATVTAPAAVVTAVAAGPFVAPGTGIFELLFAEGLGERLLDEFIDGFPGAGVAFEAVDQLFLVDQKQDAAFEVQIECAAEHFVLSDMERRKWFEFEFGHGFEPLGEDFWFFYRQDAKDTNF
jgi:hypothetical protein